MQIKDWIKRDEGFAYIISNMSFLSGIGRQTLLQQEFSTNQDSLYREYDNIDTTIRAIANPSNAKPLVDLRHCLMMLHDLHQSLHTLSLGVPLTEVDLFEIKNLALLCQKSQQAIHKMGIEDVLPLPNLSAVFCLLDPDNTGVPSFYIYDSYHPDLPDIRRQIRALTTSNADQEQVAPLLDCQNTIQQQVCITLSHALQSHHNNLLRAMNTLAYADLLLAKVQLIKDYQLSRPLFSDTIHYTNLFNPHLRDRLTQQGSRYQPIDILLSNGVTLITGANMSGKTVLLKTLALSQIMAQCGFFVPAQTATTMLFDDVLTSIGDEQNYLNGLSSFAAEMLKISEIVSTSRQSHTLNIIDEPARTTNPIEGTIIVRGVIDELQHRNAVTIITTHYGNIGTHCRRYRVKGLKKDLDNQSQHITVQQISEYIDYSIEEDTSDTIPMEALRIANLIAADTQLMLRIKNLMQQHQD